MVVFGVVLLLLALAVIIYMWLATRGMDPVQISYGVLNVDLTPIWLFAIGGIALAAATSGLWLLAVGTRAKARRAREVRELRRQAKDSDRRTERERDAARLGSTEGRTTGTDGPATKDDRSTPILPRQTPGSSSGQGTSGRPTTGPSA
ncbi:hypothetical protein AVL62_07745 [Serinicoccus chungangensis]|uniref:Lipopolysaccharide assembly protein A domain-containing protein n=1 Tax=Serinicoccus chungangensis TaxID=767452 RepID=A0A0W8I258_9MICO|nr:hypothetical protein [Serinicoccus chungangensis]KUG51830.1 hypothetical protein AVL62_07745 [Serinicoccus chungangensis]